MTEPKQVFFRSLINLLGSWTELSSSFRRELEDYLQIQYVKPKQQMVRLGRRLDFAWYSIDCWAASTHVLPNGNEEITAIYAPREIFTEIGSFLLGYPCQHQLNIINGNTLLKIDRQHFDQLRSHGETFLLLEYYFVLQQEKYQWRMDLLSLADQQKFEQFAKQYPIHLLPGKICASYLRMTPSRYSAAKNSYLHNSR